MASTEPLPPQVIFVNGQAVAVVRNADDHVIGVAERAVQMAGYSMDRAWEFKDESGEVLGYKDDPDALRYVSLPAGTAA